jgi:hypothetical protein
MEPESHLAISYQTLELVFLALMVKNSKIIVERSLWYITDKEIFKS